MASAWQRTVGAACVLVGLMSGRAHGGDGAREPVVVALHITGFRSERGQALIALWPDGDGFPDDSSQALKTAAVDICNGEAKATFHHLPRGTYAVAVFHDANRNGKLDKNWLGMPKEGFGFSNNPRKWFAAPKFADCAVRCDGPAQRHALHIQLRHMGL